MHKAQLLTFLLFLGLLGCKEARPPAPGQQNLQTAAALLRLSTAGKLDSLVALYDSSFVIEINGTLVLQATRDKLREILTGNAARFPHQEVRAARMYASGDSVVVIEQLTDAHPAAQPNASIHQAQARILGFRRGLIVRESWYYDNEAWMQQMQQLEKASSPKPKG